MSAEESKEVDYSLNNSNVVSYYKEAAAIAQKVLASVEKACVEGATILSICEQGDKEILEETSKLYKAKKNFSKGIAFPTTVSPDDIVTPYSPLASDTAEAETKLKAGSVVKILLGAQIDGFASIVGSTIVVPASGSEPGVIEGEKADLLLATHYVNEVFLRLVVPPAVNINNEETEPKPITHSKINTLLKKVAESFGCTIIENTTSWKFDRNDVEDKKNIVLNPSEGVKGEGNPEVGEAWGIEVQISSGSGKCKTLSHRPTLHRKTNTTFQLKRTTSRQTLGEITKKFGTFPFSLRQLEDERTAKMGVLECVRGNVLRQYEVVADKDGKDTARVFTTVIINKNGIQRVAAPTIDLEKIKSDKKIEDEEILKILEQPISKDKKKKNKK